MNNSHASVRHRSQDPSQGYVLKGLSGCVCGRFAEGAGETDHKNYDAEKTKMRVANRVKVRARRAVINFMTDVAEFMFGKNGALMPAARQTIAKSVF